MRFAYADPPYLGWSYWYRDHPDAKRWDDPMEHGLLMTRLNAEYDGWALSASSPSLVQLLPLAPPSVRIAAWVKPFAAFKKNVRCAYTWEPVLFKPGRDRSSEGAPLTRDHLSQGITLRKGLTGAKPPEFCRWVLDLMGYIDGDELDDIFPGTGIMGMVEAQPTFTYLMGKENQ